MSVLRKLFVGVAPNSSLFGIPALKGETAEYDNVHFAKDLYGEPEDFTISGKSPEFFKMDGTLATELKGTYLLKHTDPNTNEIFRIGIHVDAGVLTTVADVHGLIWTNENKGGVVAQQQTLLFVMGKEGYDAYRESKRIVLSRYA